MPTDPRVSPCRVWHNCPMKNGLEHLHKIRQRQLRNPEHMPASKCVGAFTLLGVLALWLAGDGVASRGALKRLSDRHTAERLATLFD